MGTGRERRARSLARKLEAVLERRPQLVTLLEEAGAEFSDPRADLAGLLSRIAEQLEGLTTVLSGEADEYVYSLDARPSPQRRRPSS